jgi:hypothetical protein
MIKKSTAKPFLANSLATTTNTFSAPPPVKELMKKAIVGLFIYIF